ncbi:MAG: MerR family transcriptional regulator, partial [Candidatus Latescibacterota bacterium]
MHRSLGKLYYSISEVSRLSGVKPHILRYWEEEFPILRPQKNRAG